MAGARYYPHGVGPRRAARGYNCGWQAPPATFQNSDLRKEVKGIGDVPFTPGWGAPELSRFPSLIC